MRFRAIANASVHIAIPKETVFAQKQSAPTASIVNVRSGMNLSLKQILGIKNLVATSIAQLTPEYLTEGGSGLTYVVDRMKNWAHAGHITLQRGERSRLADFAAEVL